MGQIGRSTDPSTADNRDDVAGSECASFRYCNPGAQYPSARAARFGQTGYGIIGGSHKIARFPSPVNGAASNLDLLSRSYVGPARTVSAYPATIRTPYWQRKWSTIPCRRSPC